MSRSPRKRGGSSCPVRLTSAAKAGLALSFDYDRFGNRWHQTQAGQGSFSLTFDGNNRISSPGYQYDAAGNLLMDNVNCYTYDAENRLSSVAPETTPGSGVCGATTMSYLYDPDGRRVARLQNGSVVKQYYYDAAGHMITEANASGATLRAEIYAGDRHLATWTNNATYFNHADWLGTERARSFGSGPNAGQRCEKITSLPFGDGMVTQQENGGCGDPSPNHFTGKERDSESGNDYFGARYLSSSMGRMMSPDNGVDQRPEEPQSWNLYSYARNSPLALVDPTGEYVCGDSMTKQQCDAFQQGLDKVQEAANAERERYGADSAQYKEAQRAIDAYGKQGVDNGVTINVGDTGKFGGSMDPRVGSTTPTAENPNGQKINVKFSAEGLGNAGLEAHEGSHVADASDWVASGFLPALNPTKFQTEMRAYKVEASIGEGLGQTLTWESFGNRQYLLRVWGWNATNTDNAIKNILRREYNLVPGSKVKTFQKNTRGGR